MKRSESFYVSWALKPVCGFVALTLLGSGSVALHANDAGGLAAEAARATASAQTGSSQAAVPDALQSPTTAAPQAERREPPRNDNSLNYLFDRRRQPATANVLDDSGKRLADRLSALENANNFRFDNELVRTRFDKFLNTEGVSVDVVEDFNGKYLAILELLRQGNFDQAWRGLHVLAENPVDNYASRDLANRIESVWMQRAHVQGINDQIRQLRRDIDGAYWNADALADSRQSRTANQQQVQPRSVPRAQGGGSTPGVNVPAGNTQFAEGRLRVVGEYLKSVDARTQIEVEAAQRDLLTTKVRSDFGDHISALFAARRHHQVVMGAAFYRHLFKEGDYPIAMANQVNFSLQAIREVDDAVQAFNFKVENDQLAGAAESLQAAFVTNEFHPQMMGLPRDQKQKIARFWAQTVRMRNLIEARDYGGLEQQLAQMQDIASDFDPTKARAGITFAKLESSMRLGRARLAAQSGDVDLAMQELQAAAEAWPANPDISEAASTFFQTQDVVNQTAVEFDQLMSRNDYRAIFEKQVGYLSAVRDNPRKMEQFQQAMNRVRDAEMASEKAKLMARNGDAMGAWETIHVALESWPEDIVLNRLRSEYAMPSSEFVSAIFNAQEAEKAGKPGLSLSWYVTAQQLYPSSQLANAAIRKLTNQILTDSRLLASTSSF